MTQKKTLIKLLCFFFSINSVYADEKKTILIMGDSITAGYGLDLDKAYPALLEKKLNDHKLNYKVINAGLSGETTAGGLNRINWLNKNEFDVFILELGANDGLRGLDLDFMKKNLIAIIQEVQLSKPNALIYIAQMKLPPNLGDVYTKKFSNIFKEVAEATSIKLIPFILDGVGGDVNFNQADGIHPNAEGQKIIANNIFEAIVDELSSVVIK